MKLVTEEGERGYLNAVAYGAARGTALATAVSLPAYFLLMRRSATYKALPPGLKAFGFIIIGIPCISVSAEKAGEAFERSQWSGREKLGLNTEEERERKRLEGLTVSERVKDWANRNQFGIIGGSWAGSMAIAFALVARNKYQTLPQKIVQARVYAQGLTVGVLLVSALLAGVNSQGEKPKAPEDHSWRDILESEGQMSKEDRAELRKAGTAEMQRRQAV